MRAAMADHGDGPSGAPLGPHYQTRECALRIACNDASPRQDRSAAARQIAEALRELMEPRQEGAVRLGLEDLALDLESTVREEGRDRRPVLRIVLKSEIEVQLRRNVGGVTQEHGDAGWGEFGGVPLASAT